MKLLEIAPIMLDYIMMQMRKSNRENGICFVLTLSLHLYGFLKIKECRHVHVFN